MATLSPARYVPYGFARAHQVLVAGLDGETMEVWFGDATPPAALHELVRTLPYRLVPVRKERDELVTAITRAYSQQEGSAASVVDEVAGDLDLSRLMQDIPKIEDLLESEDDAPIIRMINALLTHRPPPRKQPFAACTIKDFLTVAGSDEPVQFSTQCAENRQGPHDAAIVVR